MSKPSTSKKSVTTAVPPPHSWRLKDWPTFVFPGDPKSGRHVVAANRDALVAAGALSRLGRELIVFGAPYVGWLASQAHRVADYEIAPNRPEHAPKRFGRGAP